MRKLALSLMTGLIAAACFVSAQAADFTADFEWRSRYVINPAIVVTDHSVGVLNLNLSFENGWYLNTWQAAEDVGHMVESDYTIGYAWAQQDGPWSLDLSLSYYDVYKVGSFVDGDLIAPIVSVGYQLPDHIVPFGGTASLHGTFEWYSYLGDTTNVGYDASDGFVAYAGAEGDWPLWRKLDLTIGADYGYVTLDRYDGDFVKTWVGLGRSFTPSTRFGVTYDHRFGSVDESEGVWTASLSHAF